MTNRTTKPAQSDVDRTSVDVREVLEECREHLVWLRDNGPTTPEIFDGLSRRIADIDTLLSAPKENDLGSGILGLMIGLAEARIQELEAALKRALDMLDADARALKGESDRLARDEAGEP